MAKGPEGRFSKELSDAIKPYQWKKFIGFRIESSHTMPGIPDWLFLFGPTKYLFIELKAATGTLTAAQRITFPAMVRLGIPVKVLTKKRNSIMITDVGKKDGQSFPTINAFIQEVLLS